MTNDTELISRIVKWNDREAADILIKKYYKYIFKEIACKVMDDEIALDITQEVFIAALRGLTTFDSNKASFKTWMSRIASNKVIDYFRSKQHKERLLTDSMEGVDKTDDRNYEDSVIDKMSIEECEKYFRYIKRVDRYIIMAKVLDGMTFQEIAHMMKMSSSKVKNRYYSALKTIRKEMGNHEKV